MPQRDSAPARFVRPAFALGVAVCGVLLAACRTASPHTGLPNTTNWAAEHPESASGYQRKPGWQGQHFAVAAANPIATQAGYDILKAGGSAVDAAVAVQMVLGLVEPQSSGIGGGAFLLHAAGPNLVAYDGRETAPAQATETLFLLPNGQPMPFPQAMVGGRAVGTPGVVRMLEMAHQAHGKLPWASLLQPAITLAEQGFRISDRLHQQISSDPFLASDPDASAYFFDSAGQPQAAGTLIKNAAYAQVLHALSQHGSHALHEGPIAQAIVDKVRRHPSNPGTLSMQDLRDYRPKKRAALCHRWQPQHRSGTASAPASYKICGFPPPGSGAIAIGQILGILQHTPGAAMPLGTDGLPSADWLHFYTEAARLAFADRALYVADPDFTPPPAGSWHSLLAPQYLQLRARSIGPRSLNIAPAGLPDPGHSRWSPMAEQPEYGTSHISIVDAHGNALAMTTTIEAQFGSRQMVHGFLLNNQLTDFSFAPRAADGTPVANRVQPGKRPRSSMSPTLVFDEKTGQLLMSAGSPGGPHIIHYTAKTLQGVLGWGLTPQQAIDLPNFGSLNGPTILEEARFPADTIQALQQRGAVLLTQRMTSGLQAISRSQSHGRPVWLGGADPRREGIVMGE